MIKYAIESGCRTYDFAVFPIGMTKRIKTTVYIALNRDLTAKSKPMPASLTMFFRNGVNHIADLALKLKKACVKYSSALNLQTVYAKMEWVKLSHSILYRRNFMFCDLHTHSTFSDGTFSPTEIVLKAKEIGLDAVALCDHNTVAGLDEFVSAGKKYGVTTVAGIEFSTEYNSKQLHIVGLFIKKENYSDITEIMAESQKLKEESNKLLVKNLAKDGYILDYDEIKSSTVDGFVNRANIAAALMQKGYVSSVKEAFQTLLMSKFGYYVPPKRPSSLYIIEKLKGFGSISVLAHPFLNMNEDELREFLPKAKACGLNATEAYYSLFDKAETELAEKICDEYGLLKSGGSDFHGATKPDILLGVGKGNLAIPTEIYKNLANCYHNFRL